MGNQQNLQRLQTPFKSTVSFKRNSDEAQIC